MSNNQPVRRGRGAEEEKKNFFQKLKEKKYFPLLVVGLIIGIIFAGCQFTERRDQNEQDEASLALEEDIANNSAVNEEPTFAASDGTDTYLLGIQDTLDENCGPSDDDFVWDNDCNKITLGDRDMGAEDVVYTYLRSLSLGNISASEKFSRGSSVVATLKETVATEEGPGTNADYEEIFNQNLYNYALESMEIQGIDSTQNFGNNSTRFTVNAKMNDYAYKEFWREGETTILEDMYSFDQGESDPAKADNYLFGLVEEYWRSDDAKKKDVQFAITVKKHVDVNSGWVVSDDKALDAIAKNTDGRSVIQNIKENYQEYKTDRQTAEREEKSEQEAKEREAETERLAEENKQNS